MSLYKNCGLWKNFDCVFEFSMKSYVRNTINLSCAKIMFPSVISSFVGMIMKFMVLYLTFDGGQISQQLCEQ